MLKAAGSALSKYSTPVDRAVRVLGELISFSKRCRPAWCAVMKEV
jgi:hypothetical protein